jgi:hypothetical protein
MAKNIRITKANQIAVNEIISVDKEMRQFEDWRDNARERGDEKLAELWQGHYKSELRTWSAMINLLAKMNNLSFTDMVMSDNYHTMQDIADANLD